jgi:hypothetical protein
MSFVVTGLSYIAKGWARACAVRWSVKTGDTLTNLKAAQEAAVLEQIDEELRDRAVDEALRAELATDREESGAGVKHEDGEVVKCVVVVEGDARALP